MSSYAEFLARKAQADGAAGFEPSWMPEFLFDPQRDLTGWAIRQGRGARSAAAGGSASATRSRST
jgi:hypothetical protein